MLKAVGDGSNQSQEAREQPGSNLPPHSVCISRKLESEAEWDSNPGVSGSVFTAKLNTKLSLISVMPPLPHCTQSHCVKQKPSGLPIEEIEALRDKMTPLC